LTCKSSTMSSVNLLILTSNGKRVRQESQKNSAGRLGSLHSSECWLLLDTLILIYDLYHHQHRLRFKSRIPMDYSHFPSFSPVHLFWDRTSRYNLARPAACHAERLCHLPMSFSVFLTAPLETNLRMYTGPNFQVRFTRPYGWA